LSCRMTGGRFAGGRAKPQALDRANPPAWRCLADFLARID
jgi:hypothetical protein